MSKYLKPILAFFRKFMGEGHERSVKAKKNIIISIVIKGGSIGVSLLLVPLTINYVNADRYGIWLTLSFYSGLVQFFRYRTDAGTS